MVPIETQEVLRLTQTVEEFIGQFRRSRVALINSNEAPRSLTDGVKTMLHLVPTESVTHGCELNLKDGIESLQSQLRPMFVSSEIIEAGNSDGIIFYDHALESRTYTQLFHSGAIEAVYATPLFGEKKVQWAAFELWVKEGALRYLAAQRALGVAGPVSISLSFANTEDSYFFRSIRHQGERQLKQKAILVPTAVLTDDAALMSMLEQMFHTVWEVYGVVRPPQFSPID